MPLDRHISVFAEPAFEPRNVLSLRGEATSRRPRISRQASTRQEIYASPCFLGALATALIIRLCPSQHLCGNQPVCRVRIEQHRVDGVEDDAMIQHERAGKS